MISLYTDAQTIDYSSRDQLCNVSGRASHHAPYDPDYRGNLDRVLSSDPVTQKTGSEGPCKGAGRHRSRNATLRISDEDMTGMSTCRSLLGELKNLLY